MIGRGEGEKGVGDKKSFVGWGRWPKPFALEHFANGLVDKFRDIAESFFLPKPFAGLHENIADPNELAGPDWGLGLLFRLFSSSSLSRHDAI